MTVKNAQGGATPLNQNCRRRWMGVCILVVASAAALFSQTWERPGRITEKIDSSRLVTLGGHVRPDLTAERDLGPVEDELPLQLYVVLQRTPEQQAELDNLIARQQQPTAPEYHQWLTPQQFGARFGASPRDIAKITAWLESQGLHVNGVMNNQTFIDFSATAGQVREIFRTDMHYFNIRGGKHPANTQDPVIPAALAPVVSGIKGLSKIPPRALHTTPHQTSFNPATHSWHRPASVSETVAIPNFLDPNDLYYDVAPQDFYTIYNVAKVLAGNGTTAANLGAGATVAVIEETDIEYGTVDSNGVAGGGDVATFRNMFGVPGTLNMHVYHGYGTVTCSDPGILNDGETPEAALDSEWASALAPSANLIFMSCDQNTSNGIFTSMLALVDNNLADAMSMSYGESELNFATSDYAPFDTMYAQAAAQGQSIIISSGDAGSDVADQNAAPATTEYCPNKIVDTTGTAVCGLNVSAFSASPLVTSAGGTDFSDAYDSGEPNGPPQSSYWASSNTTYNSNAQGYVPETAWNNSCAGSLLTAYFSYTGATLCGTPTLPYLGANPYIEGYVVGGSGGFSTNYKVPAYQTGITGYSGTMRAQPDVSGFAANGIWGHAIVFCDSFSGDQAAAGGNVTCASTSDVGEGGGTSFVAPYMAGITGLLVTATGSRQGVLNPALYALAKTQFTASATKSACYSNGQTANAGVTPLTNGLPASSCIFNDVTTGNNDVPCAAGALECYVNSGAAYGMLSLGGSGSLKPAYNSTPGYDEATGIGTINVYNLITNWNSVFPSTTTLTATLTTIAANQNTVLTAVVTGGVPTGATYTPALSGGKVNFNAGSTALGSCTPSGGSCLLTVNGSQLQTGANSISATFVSGSYASSTSNLVTVTVSASLKTQTITFTGPGTQTYGVGSVTLTGSASSGLAVTYTVSGPGTVTGSTLTITGAGTIMVQASQAGNSSYAAATPVSVTILVTPAVLTLVANNVAVAQGAAFPALTGTLAGVVTGDGITAVYSTTTSNTSTVGTYVITPALSDPKGKLGNYSVTITNGSLVIFKTSSPLLLWLSPGSTTAPGVQFQLTLGGANFNSSSRVRWNGAERKTTFVNSGQLTATILASDVATAGTGLVTVANLTTNTGMSATLPFVVQSSTPAGTITGASLSDTANGSGNYMLVLTGSGFEPGSTVQLGSSSLATTYINPSELLAVVTGSEHSSPPGTLTVVYQSRSSNGFVLP